MCHANAFTKRSMTIHLPAISSQRVDEVLSVIPPSAVIGVKLNPLT